MTYQSETAPLRRVILKHVRDAFVSQAAVDRQWRALGYPGAPVFSQARREYDAFASLLAGLGVEVSYAPRDGNGLDSLYVRDAAVVTNGGAILGRMGKSARRGEPEALAAALRAADVPIRGRIEGAGQLEGGDVVWLAERSVVVARGYRTNGEGIRQFRALLGTDVDIIEAQLPHWRGPADVFHLMSIVSPIDRDLAVIYPPLTPVPLMEAMAERGIALVEVPDDEFGGQGCNVLAVAPRRCVMLEGNPQTRARLERAGADVQTYEGAEISTKGNGGPTCLTRTLDRE